MTEGKIPHVGKDMKMIKNTDIAIDIPVMMTMIAEANKVAIEIMNLIGIGEAQIKVIPKIGTPIIVGDPLVVKTSRTHIL